MLKSLFAATFWGTLSAVAVVWIELEIQFAEQKYRDGISFVVGVVGTAIVGAPLAFLSAALMTPALDVLKERGTSRAGILAAGPVLGAALGFAQLWGFLVLTDQNEGRAGFEGLRQMGPLIPAALIGGAVLGLRMAWTSKPAIKP